MPPLHRGCCEARKVRGSVAEKVMRRATCPVLTIKPFGRGWGDRSAHEAA